MKEEMSVNIVDCARCGKDHSQLVFKKLTCPNEEWSYWSLCPNNGEPIMMLVVKEQQTKE